MVTYRSRHSNATSGAFTCCELASFIQSWFEARDTTPEEYSHQNYEGGHTLYGKNTTPYLSAQLEQLSQGFLEGKREAEFLDVWEYVLKTSEFLPEKQAAEGEGSWLEAPRPMLARRDREEH